MKAISAILLWFLSGTLAMALDLEALMKNRWKKGNAGVYWEFIDENTIRETERNNSVDIPFIFTTGTGGVVYLLATLDDQRIVVFKLWRERKEPEIQMEEADSWAALSKDGKATLLTPAPAASGGKGKRPVGTDSGAADSQP